jgi:N-acetylglutamate synthase-like GNAT family acetyltransferase
MDYRNNLEIIYKIDYKPEIELIIDLFKNSGINRPIDDKERIKKMFDNANLIISAWDKNLLIGIARSLTDFCYCCYLSDLAIRYEYQRKGIGKKLIDLTKEKIGNQTALILLSAPNAMDYYPKIGFKKAENAFIIPRLY